MKLMLKLVGGLLVLVCFLAAGLLAFLLLSAKQTSRPIGVQQVLVVDPGHKPIVMTLFYPTDEMPHRVWSGWSFTYLSPNAAVSGDKHPVVVISHGTGGGSISHVDTALALADAGYVVAAAMHNGDNFQDTSEVGTSEWFVDRTRQIARVDDFLLNKWKDRNHLDPNRLGIFGFSAGGTTALVIIGGVPDFSRLEPLCTTRPEFVCKLQRPGTHMRIPAASEWTHDARVRAAVVVAPGYGFTFEPNGLSAVSARVQLWDGSADSSLPLATNALAVRRLLPESPEFHLVPNADHFAFLAPCGVAALILPKLLCTDPRGFDRVAFHKQFNAAVVAFFNQALQAGTNPDHQ